MEGRSCILFKVLFKQMLGVNEKKNENPYTGQMVCTMTFWMRRRGANDCSTQFSHWSQKKVKRRVEMVL
jgi:hypothetical protein